MCGIVGYVGAQQAAPILLSGLEKLEYRGYDSAGIAIRDESAAQIDVVKAKGKLKNLKERIESGRALHGCCGIGHTRWATHGEPSALNAHPHFSEGKRVVVVHNGILENYREIAKELEKAGYESRTQTDTEIAALLLDYCYAKALERGMAPDVCALHAIKQMMGRLRGSYAMGILFGDQPGVLYAVRKDSPLLIGCCEAEARGNLIASDAAALLGFTRKVIYMENGEMARITKDEIRMLNAGGEAVQKRVEVIKWGPEAAEKGGYAHFMMKEIHEQPRALRDTLMPRIKEDEQGAYVDLGELPWDAQMLAGVTRIALVGCGSAYHAGCVGRHVLEQLSSIPCEVDLASEFRYRKQLLDERTLVVLISQSGETADSLAALRLSKERGLKTLAIVNTVGSSMAREADVTLYTWAGPEIAVATTKAYSAQLAVLYLLAVKFARVKGRIDRRREAELVCEMLALPGKIENVLSDKACIRRFANKAAEKEDVFFIGRGLDYAISLEASLKLKEISYIHSEAYAAGELKHGAISLIEEGVMVAGVATQSELIEKEMCNMAEVRSRGAYLFCVTMQGERRVEDAAHFSVYVPRTEELFAASLAIVPLQLLAYYVSCAKGLDVDKPRNLAKSVTVE